MKYKVKLSERIEEALRQECNKKLTEEQKKVIDEIESLNNEMCQGLYISYHRPYYDDNKNLIIELRNNKGNSFFLKLAHQKEFDKVEIECHEKHEYYICPFRALYKIQKHKPYWKNSALEELQFSYGNDVIVYKDSIPTIYIYTDVKCTKELKELSSLDRNRQELVPDFSIETFRTGELKEMATEDGGRQQVIEYPVHITNGEQIHFPFDKIYYVPMKTENNATLMIERLCMEIADKFLYELIPNRGKRRLRTKEN